MNFNNLNEIEICNRCNIVNMINNFRYEIFLFFSILIFFLISKKLFCI